MNRVQKEAQISYLKDIVNEAPSMVFINFSGITVEDITKIRNDYRSANCEYKVIKNTLMTQAIKDTEVEVINGLLKGPIAIAFSREEPAAPAKVAIKHQKEFDNSEIMGGYMEGEILDVQGVKVLSSMPTKEELKSNFLATMLAVPQGLMRLMLAAPQRMLMVLDAKKREME